MTNCLIVLLVRTVSNSINAKKLHYIITRFRNGIQQDRPLRRAVSHSPIAGRGVFCCASFQRHVLWVLWFYPFSGAMFSKKHHLSEPKN